MEPADERWHLVQRLHMLDAMATAIERRGDLLDLVDSCPAADDAHRRLRAEWGFTEIQATAALDLQVRRFSARERERIADERAQLLGRMDELSD